jgi:hypothetical protein
MLDEDAWCRICHHEQGEGPLYSLAARMLHASAQVLRFAQNDKNVLIMRKPLSKSIAIPQRWRVTSSHLHEDCDERCEYA